MPGTIAYFLTWTTYGTWLPGDARGWVSHHDGSANTPYRTGDPERETRARHAMKHRPVTLTPAMRGGVESAVRHAARGEGWHLHALNVRSNHVHVVLTAPDRAPERVMASLKAWASRHLNQAAGPDRPGRWWTRHGSTRYIKTEASLRAAVEYVENQ